MRCVRLAAGAALVAAAAGCAGIPFAPVRRAPMDGIDPAALRDRLAAAAPLAAHREVAAVVFRFAWKRVAAVAALEVDPAAGRFRLTCLTPVGMKLFDLEGDRASVRAPFVASVLPYHGRLAEAAGADVRRACLDLLPPDGAEGRVRGDCVVYGAGGGPERTEYVMAGAPAVLVEKRCFAGGRLACRVRYYDYEPAPGGARPRGIVVDNKRYHYRLTVRVKDVAEAG